MWCTVRLGSETQRVQLELYETCAFPSLHYGLNAWGRIKRNKTNELEKIQGKMLTGIFHLPIKYPMLKYLSMYVWDVWGRFVYMNSKYQL